MVCDRLSQIVSVLHNMVRSADIPSKSRSQELFKCLQKFYGIVEQLTKHVRNACIIIILWTAHIHAWCYVVQCLKILQYYGFYIC